MKIGRTNGTKLWLIPAIALLIIFLMGCAQTKQMMPKQPIKPTLEVMENPKDERGICLDADNTYLLLDYIWQLEEGYR